MVLLLSSAEVSQRSRLLIAMRTLTFRRANGAEEQFESMVTALFSVTVARMLIDFYFETPPVLLVSCHHLTFCSSAVCFHFLVPLL